MHELQYNPILRMSLLATMGAIIAFAVARRYWTGPSRVRAVAGRMMLAAMMSLYALSAAELLLYTFHAESSGSGATLASRRWFQKYWKPINSLGYRDREHSPEELAGKKILAVVGDSFVAGCGIADAGDRFSDQLAGKLGAAWRVVNIAKPGWHSRAEYEALVSYPHVPDVVVLSYFINDIDGAAEANGIVRPATGFPKPRYLRSWINRSHLLNLAFSRWHAGTHPGTPDSYWRFLNDAYANPAVWRTHSQELSDIIEYCNRNGTRLLVLIIPNLRDVESSRSATSRVAGFLVSRGVPILDLTDVLAGRDPREMVVNRFDAHPNAAWHLEIADRLYDELARREFGMAEERRVSRAPSTHVSFIDRP